MLHTLYTKEKVSKGHSQAPVFEYYILEFKLMIKKGGGGEGVTDLVEQNDKSSFVWLRLSTENGSVSQKHVWSILLIQSDF